MSRYDLDAIQADLDIFSILDRLEISYLPGSGAPNGNGVKILNPFRNDKNYGSCSIRFWQGRWYVSDFADADCNMGIFDFIINVKKDAGENFSFADACVFAIGGADAAKQYVTNESSDDYYENNGKPIPLSQSELMLIGLGHRPDTNVWHGAVINATLTKPDYDELDKGTRIEPVTYFDVSILYPNDIVPQVYTEYLLVKNVTKMSLSTLYNTDFDTYKELIWNKSVDALLSLEEIISNNTGNLPDEVTERERAQRKETKIYAFLKRLTGVETNKTSTVNDELEKFVSDIAF